MARPRHENPTPAELEILQVIWEQGPSTVREVMNALNERKRRAYTSVMSLMTVMAEKGHLKQKPRGRALSIRPSIKPRISSILFCVTGIYHTPCVSRSIILLQQLQDIQLL